MEEVYDENVDYWPQMLFFCSLHKYHNIEHWNQGYNTYGDSLIEVNRQLSAHKDRAYMNYYWWKWLMGDRRAYHAQWLINQKFLERDRANKISAGPSQDNWVFVTLNFNDTVPMSADKMLYFAQRVCAFDWVLKADYVLERHRVAGIHQHVHLLIDLNKPMYKSKVAELIYKIGGIKKYCSGKQYVDCKVHKEKNVVREKGEFYRYVRGEKSDVKMPYVLKDRVWRAQNKIDDLYEYVKV